MHTVRMQRALSLDKNQQLEALTYGVRFYRYVDITCVRFCMCFWVCVCVSLTVVLTQPESGSVVLCCGSVKQRKCRRTYIQRNAFCNPISFSGIFLTVASPYLTIPHHTQLNSAWESWVRGRVSGNKLMCMHSPQKLTHTHKKLFLHTRTYTHVFGPSEWVWVSVIE